MSNHLISSLPSDSDLNYLFKPKCLTRGNVAVYLGSSRTPALKQIAHNRGLELLQHFGIVPSRDTPLVCAMCNTAFGTTTDENRYLGWRYICEGKHALEPTKNTILEGVRLDELGADSIVTLVYLWFFQWPVTVVAREVPCTIDIAVAWFQCFREVAQTIAWHDFQQIGSAGDIIEVNQAHLFESNRMVRRMKWREAWLFGGISRTTKLRFTVIVPDLSCDTLLPVMQQYIDSDSFVCTDGSKRYRICEEAFAGHGHVSLSRNKDPSWVPPGGFHTRTSQVMWRPLKTALESCDSKGQADSYIGEWMYRQNVLRREGSKEVQFSRFLRDISRVHPGIGRQRMIADLENCVCHECSPS